MNITPCHLVLFCIVVAGIVHADVSASVIPCRVVGCTREQPPSNHAFLTIGIMRSLS